jgi:HEAT repeat protein
MRSQRLALQANCRSLGLGLAVAMAVVQLGVPIPACGQSMSEEEFNTALQLLRNGTPEQRAEAADVLGRRAYRQREQVAPLLRELIRNDADWRVRASAGRALGRLGVRDAVPDLVRALRDPVVDVRVVAAAAIWRLPDPAAVPALLELLNDSDANARQWAALALGVIRDTRATGPLIRLLGDSVQAVRLDAIRSLGRIRDPAAVQPLERHVRDEAREIGERIEAISSLAMIEGPEKLDALIRLLELPNRELRQRVVEALGQVGDAVVIPALRRRRAAETGPMRNAIDAAIRSIEQRARERAPGTGPPT